MTDRFDRQEQWLQFCCLSPLDSLAIVAFRNTIGTGLIGVPKNGVIKNYQRELAENVGGLNGSASQEFRSKAKKRAFIRKVFH